MQAATAVVARSPTAKPASRRGRTTQTVLSVLGPAILGFGCGISAFLKAYYDLDVWGWIGLGLLAVVIALVVGSGRPRGVAFPLALGGLVGLWLWSLLSTVWAESSDQALVVANRWLLYAAFFMVACYAARRRGGALGLLGGVAAGGLVTVLYIAVNLLGSAATGFFSGRRLYDPLGYVNGMGTYLLVGAFWPAVALAERARPIPLAALAAGVASLTADLMLLTQSRGVAAAAIASVIAVMAIVPGRVARGWLLFLVVVAFAAAAPALLAVYQDGTGSRLNPSTVHHAATIALVAAAGVAAAWGGVLLARRRLASRYPDRTLRAIAALALAGVLVAGLVVLAIFSGRIADDISRQYDAFVHPGPSGGPQGSTTRLISGAGYRYDYWRIAWSDFTAHPLNGVGAGGYDVSYYRKRATTENIRQPHSVELQVLGETGIVGGLALLAFVTGVYLAVFQRRELARTDLVGRGMIVAALGGFTTWLVHTSVDWMSLMPGMTGMALCGAAVLTVYDGRPVVSRRISRSLVAVGVLVVLLGAVFLGRTTIAERLELDGQAELASNPTQALHDAQRSLAYNGASVPARYVESGAYERMGDYARSRGALLAALDQEPSDWVTWVLLGDSAVRRGDLETARADYRVAHGLNPLDPTVAEAARNPRSSLGPTR